MMNKGFISRVTTMSPDFLDRLVSPARVFPNDAGNVYDHASISFVANYHLFKPDDRAAAIMEAMFNKQRD
jgi:hypothetical protein